MGIAIVHIDKALLAEWLCGKFPHGYSSDAPDDLEVVAVGENVRIPAYHSFDVLVRSETFDGTTDVRESPPAVRFTFTSKE